MSKNVELSAPQRRTIRFLLTEQTQRAAAEAAGVNENTITRWMREPDFREALADAERAALAGVLAGLLSLTARAIEGLSALLDDEKAPVRLRAIDLIVSRTLVMYDKLDLKGQIDDLAARIEQLEDKDGK